MRVSTGDLIGRYEVLSVLGEGGMGAVYRARDPKLKRDVALKIVHPGSGLLPDIDRVRHEAHMLASLAHPHIAAVYELEDTTDLACLVMELVPGDTLRERLAAGALSVAETLRIAAQIAAAVEAAHERGIVHRDLKPPNIKITPDGTVKVLDFGLAQVLDVVTPQNSIEATRTGAAAAGVIAGTAAYMSPEQARGRPLDRRTDIWSFGCIVFEMLAGRPAFAGETISDTTAAILSREPDLAALPPLPPPVIRLLQRCLEKDARRRLRDIGDARIEIEDALAALSGAGAAPSTVDRLRGRTAQWAAIFLAGGALGVGAILALLPRPRAAPPSRVQFVASMPAGARLASLDYPAVAVSPDGSHIAYIASQGGPPQLFIQDLQTPAAIAIPGTFDAISPFFSPDGGSVGFFADGKLKTVAVTGGASVTVCDAPTGFGATWRGDHIIFAATAAGGLSRVAASGGTPARVTTLDASKGEFSHRWPELLPDNRTVLFTVGTVGSWDDADIVAQSLTTGERRVLVHRGTHPHYLPSGSLVYTRAGVVMSVPFDVSRLTVTGAPTPVLDNVLESADGAAQIATSSAAVVYVPAAAHLDQGRLLTVDQKGAVTPFAAPPRRYVAPRVSPDGRSIAVTVSANADDLWLYDIARGSLGQLTFEAAVSSSAWTPDGARIGYASSRNGPRNLFWRRIDGAGAEERLASSDRTQLPGSWSPDGRTLAYVERDPNTGRDIWLLTLDGDRKPRAFMTSSFDETAPRISPDGRLVAYVSNESGANQVYVASLAQPSRRRLVSAESAAEPVWARTGRDLFFRAGDRVMAASAEDGAELKVSQPRVLFEGAFARGTMDFANYDVTAAGQFVMVEATDPEAFRPELVVLLNWFRN